MMHLYMQRIWNVHRDVLVSLIQQRDLLLHLIRRDVANRYKGSYFGVLWAIANPLLLLGVYTLVFSTIMHSRWDASSSQEGHMDFAIILFAGLLCFNVFADTTSRASTIVLDHKNYVKKVVFPLHFLPLMALASALFTGAMSLSILMVAIWIFKTGFGLMALLIPVLLLPLIFMTLGAALLIAALGVYIRDVAQIVGLFNMVFMFLSPIFFPIERTPERLRSLAEFNPLAVVVTQMREILIFHGGFDWYSWEIALLVSLLILELGLLFFRAVQRGFADVI